ncbi:MAG: hypothetical protein JWM28_1251 [Chitinophagaceae bacterium]|nr:hypothetical protein [Chitinophagaceae bacterium]
MAQSHHRKKHKEHLRQFQHRQENNTSVPKRKAAVIFAVVGTVIGLAVSYFSSDANLVWIAAGAVAGGVAGYLFGRNIDKGLTK